MATNGANSLKLIRKVVKFMAEGHGFDKIMNKVRIVSAGEGRCVAEMTVEEEHQNSGGTLHGGLTATLVDCVSTCALMTQGRGVPGVSVDMHIMYMNAARQGEEIVIDAHTLKSGKTLAFLDVGIIKKKTGQMVAKGTHTKFIGA